MGGGANTTLELAQRSGAGTLNALGTTFTNFGTVTVDTGAIWTVRRCHLFARHYDIHRRRCVEHPLGLDRRRDVSSLAEVSNFGTIDLLAGNNTVTMTDTTLSGGSVTINDGASGNNTVSAASDTSVSQGKTLTYDAGNGKRKLTGGFENDTVGVSVAALSGDTLTGGSGTNTLVLTTAGVPTFSGVSNFATIDLAPGNSTVTVTDAMLSVGALTINDGSSGNNTISAAGDTSASRGKTLNYNAGPGTDSFTGGFENDTVDVSVAALSGDVLTGGSGTNTLVRDKRRHGQPRHGQHVHHDRLFPRQQHGLRFGGGGEPRYADRWQRDQHAGTDERGHGQPRRCQQVWHDQSCCRQQHGDGDRYDAVRRVVDDQRRSQRQQHRQRGE